MLISFAPLSGSTLLGQGAVKFILGLKDSVKIIGIDWEILEIEKVDSHQRYSLNHDNSPSRFTIFIYCYLNI